MSIFKDFREFALKGNFVDLAVGVIIGAASGNVVKALVDKVIMPPIGLATGRVNFTDLRVILKEAVPGPDGKPVGEVAIGYGAAIQAFIELLIIGFVVFMIVRFMQKLLHEKPPPPPPQEALLTEIRDLLKAQQAAPATATAGSIPPAGKKSKKE